jgi:hypothetical protein
MRKAVWKMPKNKSENKELILLNFPVQTGVFHASSFIKISSKPMNLKSWKQKMSSFTSMQIFQEIKKSAFPELKKKTLRLLISTKKGLFPYTLLLNSEGKILKSWEGLPSENALAFSKEIRISKKIKNKKYVKRIQKTSETNGERF